MLWPISAAVDGSGICLSQKLVANCVLTEIELTLFALDGVEPKLPEGFCFIAENASVVGNVIVGEDAGIWFGVVLRGDNEPIKIGKRSNIQDNTVIHTDPGAPVTIGEGWSA